MKLFFLLPAVFLSLLLKAQRPDSVRVFVDSALSIMQHHAMNAPRLNWQTIKDSATRLSADAKTYAETLPALQYAFNQLGDKHGWLVIDDKDYHNTTLQTKPRELNEATKKITAKGPTVYAHRLGAYAYVSIPFFGGQTVQASNAFAQKVQDSLCKVTGPSTKGLIIDLRLNPGGNTFAMAAGLATVFGNQKPAQKGYAGDWNIKNYTLCVNDTFCLGAAHRCADYSKLPVAVLIGPQTASAGEFLALAFLARKNTVLIGEHTAGYTSGNNGFLLPGANNGIVVAEDFAIDVNGKLYPDGLDAQIEVVGGDDFFAPEKDGKMKAALKWLAKRTK